MNNPITIKYLVETRYLSWRSILYSSLTIRRIGWIFDIFMTKVNTFVLTRETNQKDGYGIDVDMWYACNTLMWKKIISGRSNYKEKRAWAYCDYINCIDFRRSEYFKINSVYLDQVFDKNFVLWRKKFGLVISINSSKYAAFCRFRYYTRDLLLWV